MESEEKGEPGNIDVMKHQNNQIGVAPNEVPYSWPLIWPQSLSKEILASESPLLPEILGH